MKLQQAREDVVLKRLAVVEAGLIARTWGNVGARSVRTICDHPQRQGL